MFNRIHLATRRRSPSTNSSNNSNSVNSNIERVHTEDSNNYHVIPSPTGDGVLVEDVHDNNSSCPVIVPTSIDFPEEDSCNNAPVRSTPTSFSDYPHQSAIPQAFSVVNQSSAFRMVHQQGRTSEPAIIQTEMIERKQAYMGSAQQPQQAYMGSAQQAQQHLMPYGTYQQQPPVPDFQHRVAQPAYNSLEMNQIANAAYTKAMSDAARIQMMTAAQFAHRSPAQPIIIQNTTKAVAEASQTDSSPPPRKKSFFDPWAEMLLTFWSSRLNRLLVMGIAAGSLYLFWEWTQHSRRMQVMQRRIEASPLLRLSQRLSQQQSTYY